MQVILTMLALTLMMYLSACAGFGVSKELIQKQRFIYLHVVEENGMFTIDPGKSFCRERDYRYTPGEIGAISKFKEVPLMKCSKTYGYDPSSQVRVHEFLEEDL